MEKAEIQEIAGGYLFTWPTAKIAIRVSRLRAHSSDGHISGEILLTGLPDDKPLYPPTSINNFGSDRSRVMLAKSLQEQSEDHDWATILKQVCLEVPERFRAGEPVRELWTSEEVSPPEWLLEPILYRELPTIIYGEKATAKSTLALAAYTCLTLPWHDNPLGWVAPARPVRTLLLDYEVGYKVAQWGLKRLQVGMGLPDFSLSYRRGVLPLADDIDQVAAHIAKQKAEAIIIDSLSPAVGGDSYAPESANRFNLALRQLNCAALIIGQTSKQADKKKSVLGTTLFEYFARHIFELRKVQEEGEDTLDVALFNTYHNLGKPLRPQGFRISYNGLGAHIESQPITAPELIARMGAGHQILKMLRRGVYMPPAIAKETGLTENTVKVALSRLKVKGLVIRIADGYCLPTEVSP